MKGQGALCTFMCFWVQGEDQKSKLVLGFWGLVSVLSKGGKWPHWIKGKSLTHSWAVHHITRLLEYVLLHEASLYAFSYWKHAKCMSIFSQKTVTCKCSESAQKFRVFYCVDEGMMFPGLPTILYNLLQSGLETKFASVCKSMLSWSYRINVSIFEKFLT